jgi:hypothetical protein
LLPISSVPQGDDIAVASDLAFARLQQATNPAYTLTTRVEGTCRQQSSFNGTAGTVAPQAAAPSPRAAAEGSGVTVAASGVVGAFEWTALALDPALEKPAAAAINWLTQNGYDVTPGLGCFARPYLADGNYLLALRLTKGSDTGSIRPIVLTYDADLPMIPIKLTAVSANDDMGVMTGCSPIRARVPMKLRRPRAERGAHQLVQRSSNYNDVVTAAADDAGGQGFVTEFAAKSSSLAGVVWPSSEEQSWQQVRSRTYGSLASSSTRYTTGTKATTVSGTRFAPASPCRKMLRSPIFKRAPIATRIGCDFHPARSLLRSKPVSSSPSATCKSCSTGVRT